MELLVDRVTPYVLKQTVSGLFDVWDEMLWRGVSLKNWGSEQYAGMFILADALLSQLLSHGVSREDVQKRLMSSPSKQRSERAVVIWYHYLAGRAFMANVPYCMDAPTPKFARADGDCTHRRCMDQQGWRRRWGHRHSYADNHTIRLKWELEVFAAIGHSGDLYALPRDTFLGNDGCNDILAAKTPQRRTRTRLANFLKKCANASWC